MCVVECVCVGGNVCEYRCVGVCECLCVYVSICVDVLVCMSGVCVFE